MKASVQADFKKAWAVIAKSQKIFMTTHAGTDGDDLGSLLAMRSVLEKMGKELHCIVKGGVPHTIAFLPGSGKVTEEFESRPYDLVITFGCNKLERPGFPELEHMKVDILNFDHHPDNQLFGSVNVIDPDTAAVAELIYFFFKANAQVEIDMDIATCLLTGIFTDTGGFKHSNTSSTVFEVAGELMKKGARIDTISRETYYKRPQTLRAWAKGFENTRFDPERKMVFSVMTDDDMREVQAEDEDLAGFVEVINHIPQANFALLLRQDGDEVKGSLRSEPTKATDVSEIARFFGGGGHKYASGFKIKGRLLKGEKGWKIEPKN